MKTNLHTFECACCHQKVEIVPTQHIPPGWYMRKIQDRNFLLCSLCGVPSRFTGDLPQDLKEKLKSKYGMTFDDNKPSPKS
jgi:hypothetical protein